MKAQSAIEFITTYSWAFLLVLLVSVVVLYYLSFQQPAPQCTFDSGLQCQTFKFFKDSTGVMRLLLQLSNGMGKVISINGTQTITVTNVGKSGVNTYNGTCWGANVTLQGGDVVFCAFNITDTTMVPSTGKNIKFDVALNYTDCETSPNYPYNCSGGLSRTSHGLVIAPFEVGTNHCGDLICTSGETCSNCPIDCGVCLISSCNSDCTFNGICNASCVGVNFCSNFLAACNLQAVNSQRCSDSSGGTSGALNYYVSCCNGAINPAFMCYQNTPTTVGYCGDRSCDAAHGEDCSTCPLDCGGCNCRADCTFGSSGICTASCSYSCTGWQSVCDGLTQGVIQCSGNSQFPCCNGALSACGTSEYCNASLGGCTACAIGTANCNNDATCDVNTNTDPNHCGSCTNACTAPQICVGGTCQFVCQSNCTWGDNTCHQGCVGQGTPPCSNFHPACDLQAINSQRCSDSSGGTSGALNYYTSCCNGTITNCPAGTTCAQTTPTTVTCISTLFFSTSAVINITDPTGIVVVSNAPMTCNFNSFAAPFSTNDSTCGTASSSTANQTIYICTYPFFHNCSKAGAWNATIQFTHTSGYNAYDSVVAPAGDIDSPPPSGQVTGDCTAPAICATDPLCRTGSNEVVTGTLYYCSVPTCQPDCTFGSGNICNASCSSYCSNFRAACDTFSKGANRCSDSSGGTSGALNNYTSCCNGTINPAFMCYQVTPTTVGWCGDKYCDAAHGEGCSTCPSDCGGCGCNSDCTFSSSGICNASCSGFNGCTNFRSACGSQSLNAQVCSDSSGGTSGALNYYTSCCNGTITNCPAGTTCAQTTPTTVTCISTLFFSTSAVITIKDPTGAVVVSNAPMTCNVNSFATVSTDASTACGPDSSSTANQTKYTCTYPFTPTCSSTSGDWTATVQFTHTSGYNAYDSVVAPAGDIDSPPPSGQVTGDCTAPAICATDPLCRTGSNEVVTGNLYHCS